MVRLIECIDKEDTADLKEALERIEKEDGTADLKETLSLKPFVDLDDPGVNKASGV